MDRSRHPPSSRRLARKARSTSRCAPTLRHGPNGSTRCFCQSDRCACAAASLPGFADGAWWVQDAASAAAGRLVQARPGERIADLCAAPGGKTLQLAAAGAQVTAVDRSPQRMRILEANLARCGLSAEIVVKDALDVRIGSSDAEPFDAKPFDAKPFDAVLLDAPCSATGTIRRHPDIAWTKTPQDRDKLADLQRRLLDHAVTLLKPGGRLIYCTCSLEPQEGEHQAHAFLQRHPGWRLDHIDAGEVGLPDSITPEGVFRALPHQIVGDSPRLGGWGGFFAARFVQH
jgi:16S rRNA (cytosine967-C5)-methyltransferase